MPRINGQRLLDDLRRLRQFGGTGSGVVRTALSEPDIASREWLSERMRTAGLRPVIDGVGTVFGTSPQAGPALIIGSHTDTQPRGGWLDGAMGVMYGLEVARAFAESDATAGLAVDVASWMDEEGKFGHFIGSRAFFGELEEAEIAEARDGDGTTLAEALMQAGYAGRDRARFDPRRHCGYLEAHVEQGGRLEQGGLQIGVVTAIVGIRAFGVRFSGEQNHAGTTPMPARKDAGMALVKFAYALNETWTRLAATDSVWTFGNITLDPGAQSIVPGAAELLVQFRDGDDAVLDRFEQTLNELAVETNAAGPVGVAVSPALTRVAPAAMDDAMQAHLAHAAEANAAGLWTHMPSGAGHDAQVTAAHLPTGMLFVPSIGGISHSFEEDTADDDIVLGCQVLADAAERFLRAAR